MFFIRPEFLYGLIALLIPVIIHLFNFRRHRKLYFSDISRLKNITTHTRKHQKLKHLIVLLMRILAIVFIVLALSGPELKKDEPATSYRTRTVALYVDNSFSMMAEGNNGRLFENARQDAIQIIEHSTDNTNFIVISNNNNGQLNRVLGKETAVSELEKLEITSDSKKLSQVMDTRNRVLQNSELQNCDTYIFSDFQANSSDITSFPDDSTNNYFFIPFHHLQNKNIYIDSCRIDNPDLMKNKVIGLTVWIKNDSDTDYEKVPLKLMINEQQKAVAGIDIEAGTTKKVNLNFTVSQSGWHTGLIEIEDFPITFDDRMYFAFNVRQFVEVLVIGPGDNNKYLEKFYNSDDIFNISEMNYRSIDFSLLKNINLIILNGIPDISTGLISKAKQYIKDGGNLLFIPPLPESVNEISVFLKEMNAGEVAGLDTTMTRITGLKLTNNLLSESVIKVPKNADLPIVKQHYSYRFPVTSGVETIVSLLSGDDFLSKKNIGSGHLYLLSAGLDNSYGNFASHLLFVPVMHGIASKSGSAQKLYYTLGEDNSIVINTGNNLTTESPFTLFSLLTQHSIIPGQQYKNGKLYLSLDNIILQNGYYNFMMFDSTLSVFAFNFNRDESEMDYFDINELTEQCKESGLKYYRILNTSDPKYTEVINALQKESDFWKLFIIFALFVILIEILILRFWK
ncbi:MAG: BatA domain-containing protein [Bacteroidetes bacterium]|nr:BatA domain-containing protein [Bacteroidota bacterium]MBL6944540.1 BatA domain-containing protein [Bacteroidales bacterium]